MNNKILKPISLVLSAALLTASISVSAFAINSAEKAKDESKKETASVTNTAADEETKTTTKDETVYVLAGADGAVQKIIVSDWIKNAVGTDKINDKSELGDVQNVKGDESYTMNGDNMKVWDADGNDIYYQGNIEKELPVTLAVSYKLNGETVSPTELAGKSGDVSIRFDYKNNQYKNVTIDGKSEKIYVPFAMLTGMMLDNDVFTNVEVSNGRLLNDGDHTVVAGIAFPGLQDNLGINKDTYEIPDYVEIKATVKDFEMTNTVTIATNEIFNKIDTDKLDSVDELSDSLDELNNAMSQLINGSSKLYKGLDTLLEKSGELVEGIDKLSGGLKELTSNNDALNSGSKQVFESLLNVANTQLKANGLDAEKLTIDNYATVLNGVIKSLDKDKVAEKAQKVARKKVTAAVNAKRDDVTAAVTAAVKKEVEPKVTAAVRTNVEDQVLATMNLNRTAWEAGIKAGIITAEQQAQFKAAVDAQMQTETVKGIIAAQLEAQMKSSDVQKIVKEKTDEQVAKLIEENMNSKDVQSQITAALEQAKSGAASISALKEQLDQYKQFYVGLNKYTAGVSEVYAGVKKMQDSAPQLVDGVTQLRDGSKELMGGLKEFNEKGVQKLIDAVDGDLANVMTRFKATVDVSKEYKSFSGISDDMDGQVKFIYRTEDIEK